jgi:hypothetical protein
MNHLDRQDEKLNKMAVDVSEIKATIKDYPDVTMRLADQGQTLLLIKQNCEMVQAAKKATAVPWGNVKGAVIGGIITGIIMLAIGLYVGTFLN